MQVKITSKIPLHIHQNDLEEMAKSSAGQNMKKLEFNHLWKPLGSF